MDELKLLALALVMIAAPASARDGIGSGRYGEAALARQDAQQSLLTAQGRLSAFRGDPLTGRDPLLESLARQRDEALTRAAPGEAAAIEARIAVEASRIDRALAADIAASRARIDALDAAPRP